MRENRRLISLLRSLPALCAALIALLIALVMPNVASASVDYPPGAFTLTLSASTVPPGAAVSATVNGCEIGVVVRMSVDGTSISSDITCVAAPAAATFRRLPEAPAPAGTATFTFNAPTTVGTYTVRAAELTGAQRSATAVLTVVAGVPTTTVPSGELPSTGSDVWRVTASAAAVLGIGFGAVLASRRRRQPTVV